MRVLICPTFTRSARRFVVQLVKVVGPRDLEERLSLTVDDHHPLPRRSQVDHRFTALSVCGELAEERERVGERFQRRGLTARCRSGVGENDDSLHLATLSPAQISGESPVGLLVSLDA
jgi:hypothetical protein